MNNGWFSSLLAGFIYQLLCIFVVGFHSDMAGAHSVFDALSEKGITVTDQSYGALAVAYAEQGDISGVHKVCVC